MNCSNRLCSNNFDGYYYHNNQNKYYECEDQFYTYDDEDYAFSDYDCGYGLFGDE